MHSITGWERVFLKHSHFTCISTVEDVDNGEAVYVWNQDV